MRTWTRDDTKDWIAQVELRVEDIDYYLQQTINWCENHDVYDDQTVFACVMMTTLWVAWQRNEDISRREVFEILGIKDWYNAEEEVVELGPRFQNMELEDILYTIIYEDWH